MIRQRYRPDPEASLLLWGIAGMLAAFAGLALALL